MILQLLFWLSVFFLLFSYLLYPSLLWLIARGKKANQVCYSHTEPLPLITILMSVYNEEAVLDEKIRSVLSTRYPGDRIRILVGSDGSTDRTDQILHDWSAKDPRLVFVDSGERQGKANVINRLVEQTDTEILVFTDANVMFEEDTLFELVKHFRNPEIGLVDTHMINRGLEKGGISIQEKAYISLEVRIKHLEGKAWGTMMGPFGGCYAIRRNLYSPVPHNFLVDDFYINMKILEKGKKSINDPGARVYEDVSNVLADEFRRKTRIATGNFQNLVAFAHLLVKPPASIAFSFLSHKILRWFGPFFFLCIFPANLLLARVNSFYLTTFIILCTILALPVLDFLLRKIHLHVVILRFVTHFLAMNLAIACGFVRFLTGVKSNVWQPTRRYQSS